GADARTRLPAGAASGLTKSVRLVEYSKETATLLVIFNEGGAPAFSDVPLHQLFGLHVSLDNLLHRQKLDAVAEQLSGATHHSKRISIVEQFLLSELHESRSDRLILHAVQQIRAANGNIRIKDLATTLAISQDAFEKRFDRSIGASPKQFARIVRLRYVINSYPQAKNLTDAALGAGYFDQAHFIKDFTAFAGTTPKDFFRSPSFG